MDGVEVELTPKIKEAPLSDTLRVQYLGDNGIYGILQDTKIRYHVLASNICADAVISGKLPKHTDFKTTVANDVELANGLIKATAKVDKEDKTAAKAFEFTFKKVAAKPSIIKDAVKAEVVKVIGAGEVSSISNAAQGELAVGTDNKLYVGKDSGRNKVVY